MTHRALVLSNTQHAYLLSLYVIWAHGQAGYDSFQVRFQLPENGPKLRFIGLVGRSTHD